MPVPLAADAGYIDEAADALAQGNVFVSPEVADSAALTEALQQQVGDESIGIAVFSSNAALEASGTEIVSQLAEEVGYDTIIVAVGDDLSAGSRVVEPAGEALRIANEAEQSTDSVEQALQETISAVIAASEPASPPPPDGSAGLTIGVVLGVAALVAAGGVLIAVVRSRRRANGGNRGLPERLRPLVAALRGLEGAYAQRAAAGDRIAARTASEIHTIAVNVPELFARLDRRSDESQHSLAAVEYEDKLRKLTAALERDYLLDILVNPQLWDDPDERVEEVRVAIDAVSTELVENIKQVNARRALHFQVSLDGLIGRRKELQEWDREFGRASGDTGPSTP